MKISSINAYGQRNIYQQRKAVQHPSITVPEAPKQSVSFQGKHSFAKGFAGIAGLLGTAGEFLPALKNMMQLNLRTLLMFLN